MGMQFRKWIGGLGVALCWGAALSVVGQDMMAERYDVDRRVRDRDDRRIITCSSQDKQYVYCAIRVRDTVRLHRQLSAAPCRLGRSWGYDAGGIWVDNGCRAEFVVP